MAMTQTENDLLTLTEVAKELRVSIETARTLTANGTLPYVNVGTGTKHILRRVRRGDLDSFKRASQRAASGQQFAAAKALVAASTARGTYY